MSCEECLEFTDNLYKISNNDYCEDCINKYMLVKCPGELCVNVISLNGYDELSDINNNTCSICDAVYCDDCFIRTTNVKICKDCLNT